MPGCGCVRRLTRPSVDCAPGRSAPFLRTLPGRPKSRPPSCARVGKRCSPTTFLPTQRQRQRQLPTNTATETEANSQGKGRDRKREWKSMLRNLCSHTSSATTFFASALQTLTLLSRRPAVRRKPLKSGRRPRARVLAGGLRLVTEGYIRSPPTLLLDRGDTPCRPPVESGRQIFMAFKFYLPA